MRTGPLLAGAAAADITPTTPMFLYGYPHVERRSEGVHDPLAAAALVLDNGETQVALCALDLIFISKRMVNAIRERVRAATGLPAHNLLVSCTHTHSGPITVDMISNRDDPAVPPADEQYVEFVIGAAADALVRAYQARRPAELAIAVADGTGVGGNRRADDGPVDPEVPVIVARDHAGRSPIAVCTTYCMHPTVLHEDSKRVSADFPGYARQRVLDELGDDMVYLYHTGPAGDQSPRRHIRANTFDEAGRLGKMLGDRIVDSVSRLNNADYRSDVSLAAWSSDVMLEPKTFPPVEEAERRLADARETLRRLMQSGAPRPEVRTAECDLFGAEEAVTLAAAAADGALADVLAQVLPAEVQVLDIAGRCFVGLPGELFAAYSLRIKERSPAKTFVIALANGELQGYIVTDAAAAEGGYEAGNGLFPPQAGERLVDEAIRLINARRV